MRARQILVPAVWLLTVFAAFLAGWFAQDAYRFCTTLGKPRVRSDWSVRNSIRLAVPESARDLYHATNGFVDTDEFTAMTIEPEEFDRWCKTCFGGDLIATGSGTIPARVTERGPDSWGPEFQDPNWNLSSCSEVSVYANGEWVDVIWCEGQDRLFVCDWGH